jgi:hypothetical protein
MPPQRAPKDRRPETAIQNSASALPIQAPAIPKSAFAILNAETAIELTQHPAANLRLNAAARILAVG